MAMDHFSYADTVRAAFTSCLPCFTTSRRTESVSDQGNEPRSTSTLAPSTSSNDLEHLLHDSDSDALSLHSNLGIAAHRRASRRRRPKFSFTLFGYTLFGRPPIYLSDGEDDGEDTIGGGRGRVLGTASSSTLDSDAAPLDASTIERLTSPDHFAALAAQRENERRRLEVEEARRKAERRARRQERKARERAAALMSLTGGTQPPSDMETFEGFQGSGDATPVPFSSYQAVEIASRPHPNMERLAQGGELDDGDDADLGGESYTRKKKSSASTSASGSDSRSRTSASFSVGDASHTQNFPTHTIHQSIPYPHTEMHLPVPAKNRPQRASKRTSTVSSLTSQSNSTAPYTPVGSIMETPAVAAFPVPHERYIRDGDRVDFPSAGLPGASTNRSKTLDLKAFLAHQG